MNPDTAAALRRRIESDHDAKLSSVATETDTALAIRRDVWRLRWRNQVTTAVAEDANLHTTCGALLDAVAVIETTTANRDRALDRSTVNVLIDQPLLNETLSEADQAMRSLRDAVSGVQARIWYRRDDSGWAEDDGPAPIWIEDASIVKCWLNDYLMSRLTTPPNGLAGRSSPQWTTRHCSRTPRRSKVARPTPGRSASTACRSARPASRRRLL